MNAALDSPPGAGLARRLWVLALFATLLRAGSLRMPLRGDDSLQLGWLEGQRDFLSARNALDLYRFFSGDPSALARMAARGAVPWWTDPRQRVAHFRPLSSALMALDLGLFGHATIAFQL